MVMVTMISLTTTMAINITGIPIIIMVMNGVNINIGGMNITTIGIKIPITKIKRGILI